MQNPQYLQADFGLRGVTIMLCTVAWAFLGLVQPAAQANAYEVWLTEQSDSMKGGGGFIYVFDGATLAKNPSTTKPTVTMDMSKEVNTFCKEATGKGVKRPHMVFFTKDQSHAVVSFLSGQVLVMDAATKKPEACLLVGKNVHAAWPTPDQKHIITANIAEKAFGRIATDYRAHTFSFDPKKDVLDLGALANKQRPDTAPICPITDGTGQYAVVTLRGGGLMVVDIWQTPLKVVATMDNTQIHPAGCGGVQIGTTMYVNSGGGWANAKFPHSASLSYDVYALDLSGLPKTISAKLLSSRDKKFADAHGMVAVGQYLWNADRAGNNIEIFDTANNAAVGAVDMVNAHSKDPAPDLIDVAPDGSAVFVALRSASPLTGNDKMVNNAKGSTPGVGVIKVTAEGKGGEFIGVAAVSNMQEGKETADPHGIAVRK